MAEERSKGDVVRDEAKGVTVAKLCRALKLAARSDIYTEAGGP